MKTVKYWTHAKTTEATTKPYKKKVTNSTEQPHSTNYNSNMGDKDK